MIEGDKRYRDVKLRGRNNVFRPRDWKMLLIRPVKNRNAVELIGRLLYFLLFDFIIYIGDESLPPGEQASNNKKVYFRV